MRPITPPDQPLDAPLPDPWNHPAEVLRRLRIMSELRELTMTLRRAYCRQLGIPTGYEIELLREHKELSIHHPGPTDVNAPAPEP